jgi:hypothetical protein
MESTTENLKLAFEDFLKEDEKFTGGNASAGTRARKALAEIGKLVKARRNEITGEKNARKAEKEAEKAAPVKVAKTKK